MTLKLNGTNSVAAPAYAGDDADTGLQCGTNELNLVTGGTARVKIASDGAVQLLSSTGIDFSGIQTNTSGMSSETLDSYEEGTWTPTLNAGGSITTVNNATYTKVGRLVSIALYYTAATLGTGTENFYIQGLPFTSKTGYGFGNIEYSAATNVAVWRPLFALNANYIYFHRTDGSGAVKTHSQASTVLLMGGIYYADT